MVDGAHEHAEAGRVLARPPFAFTITDGYLAQDLTLWPWVQRIVALAQDQGPGGSLKRIAAQVAGDGGPRLSSATIRHILTDELYETGRSSARVAGERFERRDVALVDAVDPVMVRRARRLMSRRGGTVIASPVGTAWLRRLRMIHTACGSALFGRERHGRRFISHASPGPGGRCRGLTLDERVVEQEIADRVLNAARSWTHPDGPERTGELLALLRAVLTADTDDATRERGTTVVEALIDEVIVNTERRPMTTTPGPWQSHPQPLLLIADVLDEHAWCTAQRPTDHSTIVADMERRARVELERLCRAAGLDRARLLVEDVLADAGDVTAARLPRH